MIDILHEKLVPLRDVPSLPFIPSRRQGKKLNKTTVFRWASKGTRGRRLETVWVGAERCTSMEALKKFFAAGTEDVVSPPQTEVQSDVAAKRLTIEKELDKLGL
jgi:hypothetical protein